MRERKTGNREGEKEKWMRVWERTSRMVEGEGAGLWRGGVIGRGGKCSV